MHADSWGQYGADADDTPILEKFINGLENLTDKFYRQFKEIKCPICRSDQVIGEVLEIKGIEETCCVCLSENVEIYFPNCKHANVCKICLERLVK